MSDRAADAMCPCCQGTGLVDRKGVLGRRCCNACHGVGRTPPPANEPPRPERRFAPTVDGGLEPRQPPAVVAPAVLADPPKPAPTPPAPAPTPHPMLPPFPDPLPEGGPALTP